MRREMQMVFQDPYASLNPRKRVGQIVGDAAASCWRPKDDARRARACRSCSSASGWRPSTSTASRTSSPAASASASASPARSPRRAEADHARRAGVRARRLDPGAGHQPARRPPGRARPDLHLRRPRPVASCATCPTASPSCTSASSWSSRPPRSSTPSRSTPTRPRCSTAIPIPDPRENRARRAHRRRRRAAEPDRPAVGLRLPHPLPARDGGLQRVEPPLRLRGGHLAACHHPMSVSDQEVAAATVSDASPLSSGEAAPAAA